MAARGCQTVHWQDVFVERCCAVGRHHAGWPLHPAEGRWIELVGTVNGSAWWRGEQRTATKHSTFMTGQPSVAAPTTAIQQDVAAREELDTKCSQAAPLSHLRTPYPSAACEEEAAQLDETFAL